MMLPDLSALHINCACTGVRVEQAKLDEFKEDDGKAPVCMICFVRINHPSQADSAEEVDGACTTSPSRPEDVDGDQPITQRVKTEDTVRCRVEKLDTCGHLFHTECIVNMVDESGTATHTCPLCRKPITVYEIRRWMLERYTLRSSGGSRFGLHKTEEDGPNVVKFTRTYSNGGEPIGEFNFTEAMLKTIRVTRNTPREETVVTTHLEDEEDLRRTTIYQNSVLEQYSKKVERLVRTNDAFTGREGFDVTRTDIYDRDGQPVRRDYKYGGFVEWKRDGDKAYYTRERNGYGEYKFDHEADGTQSIVKETTLDGVEYFWGVRDFKRHTAEVVIEVVNKGQQALLTWDPESGYDSPFISRAELKAVVPSHPTTTWNVEFEKSRSELFIQTRKNLDNRTQPHTTSHNRSNRHTTQKFKPLHTPSSYTLSSLQFGDNAFWNNLRPAATVVVPQRTRSPQYR